MGDEDDNPLQRAEETLALVRAQFGHNGLQRIEQAIVDYGTGGELDGYHPQQRVSLRVPGLTAKPFHDRSDFPWWDAFERATPEVLAEFERVERAGLGFTRFNGYGIGWLAWLFASEGRWNEDVCTTAPTTAALLRSTNHTHGDFLFSELSARGAIPPHTGGCNAVLSCHLALSVPPDCFMRVGGIDYRWEPGRLVAFDDSFIHSCWNTSSQRRVCLVWEVWHPELNELERQAMTVAYHSLINT